MHVGGKESSVRVSSIGYLAYNVSIDLHGRKEFTSVSHLVFNIKNYSLNCFNGDIPISNHSSESSYFGVSLDGRGGRCISGCRGRMASFSSEITRVDTIPTNEMIKTKRREHWKKTQRWRESA